MAKCQRSSSAHISKPRLILMHSPSRERGEELYLISRMRRGIRSNFPPFLRPRPKMKLEFAASVNGKEFLKHNIFNLCPKFLIKIIQIIASPMFFSDEILDFSLVGLRFWLN